MIQITLSPVDQGFSNPSLFASLPLLSLKNLISAQFLYGLPSKYSSAPPFYIPNTLQITVMIAVATTIYTIELTTAALVAVPTDEELRPQ